MTFELNHSERDVMRDMTADELESWYGLGRCPNCRWPGFEFELGPVGGASVNIACPRCDMRLNVMLGRYANARLGHVIREPKVV